MGNILTNQVRFVEKEYAKRFPLLELPLRPQNDCFQVVFRSDKHLGTLPPTGKQKVNPMVRVRNNDVILRVSSTPRIYYLTGTLITRDKYKRAYEIPLELTVYNPEAVALAYFQEKDPVKQAIDIIKTMLEREAAGIDHDRIPMVDFQFGRWSLIELRAIGISIDQKGKVMFRQDPMVTEAYKQEQEAKQKRRILETDANLQILQKQLQQDQESAIKEYERREKAKENEFKRTEGTKDQLYKICSTFREVAAKEIAEALRERIREDFARGYTPSQISSEFFALASIFDEKTQLGLQNSIIAGLYIDTHLVDTTPGDEDNNVNDDKDHQ